MKNLTRYRLATWTGIIASFIGFYFKISHYQNADFILGAALGCMIAVMVLGLKNVYANKRLETLEKLMWTFGFIFIAFIAAIVYQPLYKRNQD